MIEADARSIVQEWFYDLRSRWNTKAIKLGVRVSEEPGVNKAGVTMEAPSHIGTVTVWGNGMVEFIALDVERRQDVISEDRECSSLEELRAILDGCAASFLNLLPRGGTVGDVGGQER